jgi:riboflavin biosynthesis pyrimidine reductase
VVIYLHQEGRGIGLGNKIRAYALQEHGHDTVSANEALHLPVDARSYEEAVVILNDLGVKSIRLLTNNPAKERGLIDLGVRITSRIPVVVPANEFSRPYLVTKEERMGHALHLGRRLPVPSGVPPAPASARRRPYVHLNFALGCESHPPPKAQISSPEDWSRVHALRERYTAIAVGAETWLQDRPRLTARREHLGREPFRQPRRIVFAGNHAISFDNGPCPDFVVGSRIPRLPEGRVIWASGYALGGPLAALRNHGVVSLLVEGGPCLWKSFLAQQLADEITIFVATDSEDHAGRLAYQQFPDLLCPLRSERFGGGIILRWQADRDSQEAPPLLPSWERSGQTPFFSTGP